MYRILGNAIKTCDGVSRRDLLQAGGAGMLGMSLPQVLAAEAIQSPVEARAKAVMFIFLYGGPSQLETFDMKPDGPSGIRGPFKPIASLTPGLRICEHLPQLAQCSDKYAVVRTVNHPQNDHNGTHFIQTGHPIPPAERGAAKVNAAPVDWPAYGSVISYVDAQNKRPNPNNIPPYVFLPKPLGHWVGYDINGQYAGWLGKSWDPMATAIQKRDTADNPFYRDCTDEELNFRLSGLDPLPMVTADRLSKRVSLLDQINAGRRSLEKAASVANYNTRSQQAINMLTSGNISEAFDIRKEPAALRDRYGRNLFGQSLMMARRLIEAGTRFVTVAWDMTVPGDDTSSWDSHRELTKTMKNHLLPGLDQGLPALLEDMSASGLLDETLVFVAGEMGRTPKFINRGSADGRDHWTYCFPALLAGAGIQGGVTYGTSDKNAAYPDSDPVSPGDLAATIYESMGISPELRIPDAQGRPVPLVEDGHALRDLFG